MKVFSVEEGTPQAQRAFTEDLVATSRIAFVECRSAFARARREGRKDRRSEQRAAGLLQRYWPELLVVDVNDRLVRRAAELTADQPLRAADALHLASAEDQGDRPADVIIACWDRRLWDVASSLGFRMVPQEAPGSGV